MAKKPVASVNSMDETQKAELYVKISKWHRANALRAKYQAMEIELRKDLVASYFTDATEGTNTLNLDFGKALKAGIKINRSVDKEQLAALIAAERLKEGSNVMPLLDDLISYAPVLSVSAWKGMTDDERKIFADVVTEKPGSPELAIDTPKR